MKNKILFVEDEADLTLIVTDILKAQGFEVIIAANGVDGLEKFKSGGADIVVADVMMPLMDGFSMAKEIRKLSPSIPLLFLTAKSAIDDVEKGFELEVLLSRIRALLRRCGNNVNDEVRFTIGRYVFNVTTQTLHINGKESVLSHFEAKILEYLVANRGKTVYASELMIALWKRDDPCNRNSLHGYIHKLRRALRNDPAVSIINQRGFGYMLAIRK